MKEVIQLLGPSTLAIDVQSISGDATIDLADASSFGISNVRYKGIGTTVVKSDVN
jgi:hypothetical protein